MPGSEDPAPEAVAERRRERDIARERLSRVVDASERLRRHVEKAIAAVNGEVGRPSSFDALHELLEAQSYRLAYWRTAAHEINYRRFFDVNDLAALRVEDPEVFEATHGLLFELLQRSQVKGVRVDHPDGLFDPSRYTEMLQDLAARARRTELAAGPPFFVVVEKILSGGESIPDSWRVDGTTGYTFLRFVSGLFVDEAGARRLRRSYTRFTGLNAAFHDVAYECKRLIMDTSLASELNVLAQAFDDIGERNRKARDSPEHPFPVGPDRWKTSRILLPPELGSRRYRNVLTGQCIEPTRTASQSWIFVGEALRDLPVALLIGGPGLSA